MTFDFGSFQTEWESARKEAEDWVANFDPHLDLPELAKRAIPSGPSQAVIATVTMLIPNIRAEAERADDNSQQQVVSLCAQALRIAHSLEQALHPFGETGLRDLWWHHKQPGGKDFDEPYKWPDKDLLQSAAGDYLSHSWMRHSHIDWCILDALVWWEWAAFSWRLFGSIVVSRINLLLYAALGYGLSQAINLFQSKEIMWPWSSSWGWWPAIILVVIWYAIPTFVHYINHPWRYMKHTYQELDGAVLNPTRICTQLHTASKKGVVWPTAVWPVIDSVIARDSRVWKVARSA
jgi:hypothetical protein